MPKTHPIPRLSIIVPIDGDLAAFESTLISVLENQPAGSEILVPHDGSYDDPFDLCGEVRFVECDSSKVSDLVASAATQANGRFVHVLAHGLRATCGWTDSVLECFDHFDTGVVTPLIRSAKTGRILAAGWRDGSTGLCQSVGQGLEAADTRWRPGAYLQASFWRRDVLRSMNRSFTGSDSLEASVAYHHLLRNAGWRTELAVESTVCCDLEQIPWDQSSFQRGLRLRAIRNHFVSGSWKQSILCGGIAVAASLLRPKSLAESFGQVFAPLAAKKIARLVHSEEVTACDDSGMIVTMPQRSVAPLRRAA